MVPMRVFSGAVSTLVKKILIAVLFAVAILGGSELPILHAPQFAEAHAFVHEHMDDALGDQRHMAQIADDHEHGVADPNDGTREPGNDHGCTHVHAHCCSATAILMTVATTPPATSMGQLRIERNGAIPYGQLSNPPLRPPRLIA